jgi:hypothetical protein
MLFKNPVRTSKRTPHLTITKINWLTLFKFKEQIHFKPFKHEIHPDIKEFASYRKENRTSSLQR